MYVHTCLNQFALEMSVLEKISITLLYPLSNCIDIALRWKTIFPIYQLYRNHVHAAIEFHSVEVERPLARRVQSIIYCILIINPFI